MQNQETRVQYKNIKTETIEYGKANFVELARKKAKGQNTESEFISIATGYFTREGKRYKKAVTLPVDNNLMKKIAHLLSTLTKTGTVETIEKVMPVVEKLNQAVKN